MTSPTISDYLKYANLQMAAEAFLYYDDGTSKQDVKQTLIDGNGRASMFTETQADAFIAQWEVIKNQRGQARINSQCHQPVLVSQACAPSPAARPVAKQAVSR